MTGRPLQISAYVSLTDNRGMEAVEETALAVRLVEDMRRGIGGSLERLAGLSDPAAVRQAAERRLCEAVKNNPYTENGAAAYLMRRAREMPGFYSYENIIGCMALLADRLGPEETAGRVREACLKGEPRLMDAVLV